MNKNSSTLGTGAWLLSLIIILLFAITAMIARSYLDVSRTNIALSIQSAKENIQAAQAHIDKLEVERDSLLSPFAIGKTAERLGMSLADPGQIRRIGSSAK
ncbi:MAG: hypothetical protein MJ061_01970 [Mailhella sp.]|nr:hypothetical protein [Mailhella sp.]